MSTDKNIKVFICPSLLSGDFSRLGEEANRMLECGADWLHMDVMDGHFVDNLTIGAPVIKSLRKSTKGFLDCHLMVTNPEKWAKHFVDAGADQIVFHLEATVDPETKDYSKSKALIQEIKDYSKGKCKVGLTIRPRTGLEIMFPLLEDPEIFKMLDMVLIMTVEPGFGGQSFMENQMPKVKYLREKYPSLNIQVDGGLNYETTKIAAENGANCIVAGSFVFGSKNPKETISQLRNIVEQKMC